MNSSQPNSPNRKFRAGRAVAIAGAIAAVVLLAGRPLAQKVGYTDTAMLPGDKWHVHDGNRPQPKIIDPGTASTADAPGRPPSDATVLFDGKDTSHWRDGGRNPTKWVLDNGALASVPGSGYAFSKEEFGDCQLHLEFAEPTPPKGRDQGRGNSGVFFCNGTFEIQVLDSYDNITYPDGQCAAIYGQHPPLVNACRKPGEWQTYDILWTAPKFADGKLVSPAYATIIHNGVAVHNHVELYGPTDHRVRRPYTPLPPKGSIGLQDHGNPVRYRNIWVRELKDYDVP